MAPPSSAVDRGKASTPTTFGKRKKKADPFDFDEADTYVRLDACVEDRSQTVVDYWKLRANGTPAMQAYKLAGEACGWSTRMVREWVGKEAAGGLQMLKDQREGSCGRPSLFDANHQISIDELMSASKSAPTLRQVAASTDTSINTAKKYLKQAGWDRQVKRTKTLLTPAHMEARRAYCEKHFNEEHAGEAHADEKVFALGVGRKWMYVRHDSDEPALEFVTDKLHPAQLMVTAVVARPDRERGFDGKICLFRSGGYQFTALRASKNHDKGEVYTKDDTVNAEMYEKKLRELAFPALRETAKKLKLTEIKFQDDNAKLHTKAWQKLGLPAEGKARLPHIVRQEQSPRSPDVNVDDLYVWGVLQAGVNKRRPRNLDELWKAIQEAWEEDLTEAKLECAFRLLDPVMALIIDHNGANNFKLPHSGIRKQMREDGWYL